MLIDLSVVPDDDIGRSPRGEEEWWRRAIWQTMEGERLPIWRMTNSHLLAAVRYVERGCGSRGLDLPFDPRTLREYPYWYFLLLWEVDLRGLGRYLDRSYDRPETVIGQLPSPPE